MVPVPMYHILIDTCPSLGMLTIGMLNDMYVESRNDEHKYAVVATQEDFDRF